jgi:hypothetical protein
MLCRGSRIEVHIRLGMLHVGYRCIQTRDAAAGYTVGA